LATLRNPHEYCDYVRNGKSKCRTQGVKLIERTQFLGPLDSPWCLDGANACPPEDVGGIPGYADFRAIMADPAHPGHDDLIQWCGEPFDPAVFHLDEVNQRLMEIRL